MILRRSSYLDPRAAALLASLFCLACSVGAAEVVEGRYVYYSTPLSPYLTLAAFEADLAMHYPHPQTTWKGVAPVVAVSGPGLKRQPVPEAWLRR